MIPTMNNDSNPVAMLYWTYTLKSACPRPRCCPWICLGTDSEIGQSTFVKLYKKQNPIAEVSEKHVLYSDILEHRRRLLLYPNQIQFGLWFVILISQATGKRKIFLPRVTSRRKVLAIYEVLMTPTSLLFYIPFC